MPAPNPAVTLLILTAESSEAERLVTTLREAGIAARGMVSAQVERLGELLGRTPCDLVLCCAHDRDIDLEAALAAYRQLEIDVPLIVVTGTETSTATAVRARRGGARDLVRRDDPEHLQLVAKRELADLRQRRAVQALTTRLRQCDRRAREFVEGSLDAIAFVQEGLHLHANGAYLGLFGYADGEALAGATFLDLIPAEQRPRVREFLRAVEYSDREDAAELDTQCLDADHKPFAARLRAANSEIDEEPCLRILIRPSTPAASTGTAVPKTGRERMVAAIASRLDPEHRPRHPFALFFVQVKGGAELLRDLGLTTGLTLIAGLYEPLQVILSGYAGGMLAQVSDDGFALLVDGLDTAAVEQLTTRIEREVRLQRGRNGEREDDTPDCVVAHVLVELRAREPSDILNLAHQRCLRLLAGGKGQGGMGKPTSLASRTKQSAEEGDEQIAERIEYALEHDQFRLVYQPIISLMGDNQEHYSVLVRLFDEDEDMLEAKDFIGPAIRRGLIERIDKWAIRAAIQVISEQRRAGHNISFFINLSEDTFRDPSIVLWICDCMREFDVRGNWLTFQFQEALVAANLAGLSKLVEALRKIKCRVAINRFGVAERPEMLLQGLALDFVLLMPDFAQRLADDQQKQKRVMELANLAREFNVKSVVTGVEDARTLTVLWTAGVDYVQGNFLQRPSPMLEVTAS
ncbi:EAL domain-containing response regulator [Marichromatium bheemlicum]|uniref:EAL domain-containing protein n=1 Tax=Marichromatium bheemlicum TaxID=365339 RepID=A0ABX1IEQ3_9GAMM|nr:EAL domain-containing protein [Marichromatium bheemlicum]NKN34635.1 EAL domain-containing protein [Marichromatium bheemlicum]